MFQGRLAIQQRVLPLYRKAFFERLAQACAGGMSLYAGRSRPGEAIVEADFLLDAQFCAGRNIHLLRDRLYFCFQVGLLNWLEKWDPDALILEANPRYISAPAAARWMHQQGKPVIGWGLGAPIRSGYFPVFRRWLWKRYLDQFDAIIAYSQRGLSEYADIGFPKDRIYVAPNAVAPKPAHPLPVRPDELPHKPRILYIGRLQERKCIDNLFHACAAQDKRIDLVIVGDGPMRGRLESLATELNLSVVFTGYQTGDDLAQHFIGADLFILPGTGGLAVQEAMAYGLPVIVAQGDGTQGDLVRTGNGWLVPNDDVNALAKTIAAALSDAKRLRRMGAESYRIVSEEINLERMVDVFLEVLREVTSEPRQFS